MSIADWRAKLAENASILSADPGLNPCPGCGARRLTYQAHFFKAGLIRADCKECLLAAAGGPEKVYIRQVPELRGLPALWERDARDAATAKRLAAIRPAKRPRDVVGTSFPAPPVPSEAEDA